VKSISGFSLPAFAGTSFTGMTGFDWTFIWHSREGGNPVASIWHLPHYHLGFLDDQAIILQFTKYMTG
jgi:hypothetical protein